jgi:hypothetical protein
MIGTQESRSPERSPERKKHAKSPTTLQSSTAASTPFFGLPPAPPSSGLFGASTPFLIDANVVKMDLLQLMGKIIEFQGRFYVADQMSSQMKTKATKVLDFLLPKLRNWRDTAGSGGSIFLAVPGTDNRVAREAWIVAIDKCKKQVIEDVNLFFVTNLAPNSKVGSLTISAMSSKFETIAAKNKAGKEKQRF